MARSLSRSLLAALVLFGFAGAASAAEKFGSLTLDEVEKKLGEANVYVFDNNPRDSFKKGHVPKAKWVDFSKVSAADLPADKNATLIFYCANEQCHACHKGAESALSLGYKNVFIMPGGIMGWQKAKKPIEKA